MHEKQLRALATKSFVVMFTVIGFSFCITKYNDSKIYVSAEHLNEQLSAALTNEPVDVKQYTNSSTGEIVNEIGDNYIKVSKNSMNDIQIKIKDNYMERKLIVMIDNLDEKIYDKQAVIFSREEINVDKISLNYKFNEETLKYCAVFEFTLDNVYVQTIYEDTEDFYIELKNPHEVYDKVIVVDAGHGGNDIGTASNNKRFVEKDINLNVVLELKKLLDEDSTYKVYYTRLNDKKVYLKPRLNLANEVDADLFLSVHCNGSEYISAKGTEGLYGSPKDTSGSFTSKQFAEICVEEVSAALKTRVRGVIKKEDIYIIGNSKVPVSLVELGFMSNNEDMEILSNKDNRTVAAMALYRAINRAFEEIDEAKP